MHEFEPEGFYMRDNERHLSIDQIRTRNKCTCGYDLIPLEKRFENPAIVECQCSQCRAKIFIEIPYQKNIR